MSPTNAQCFETMEWEIDENVDLSEVSSVSEAYDLVYSAAYDSLKEQFGKHCSMENMDFTEQQQSSLKQRIAEYINLPIE